MDLAGMSAGQIEHCTQALHILREQYNGEVVLLTDCESEKAARSREIVASILKRDCRHVVFSDDTASFLQAIASCDRVITTKLHVGICASAMGIPVLSIPTHTKTPRFYRKVGLPSAILQGDFSQVSTLIAEPERHLVSKEVLQRSADEHDQLLKTLSGLKL